MLRDKSTAGFEKWDGSKYLKLAKENPIKFLIRSEGKFFTGSEDVLMSLKNQNMRAIIENNEFVGHMKEAIELRIIKYYLDKF